MADDRPGDAFEKAADAPGGSLLAEFVDFLRHNKKWWLLPLLIVLAVLGALVALGSSGAAPFLYTLF